MSRYLGWETATSLLLAYESMALAHRATLRRISADGTEPHAYYSYMHAFGLLILNASFVEGTVRTILTEKVKSDLDEAVERGKRAGRTEHDAPTRLLQKFLIELESSGGWDNLVKSAGISYYGIALDSEVDKDVKEGISVLFTLRNVLAHGTALIQPTVKMTDDMKDVYPYSWQSKLHGVGMYLERHFKRGGMFENLADPDLPEHFIDVTKKYFEQLTPKFTPLPERAQKTVDMIRCYSFGFVNNTR
ncbi:hypothetical protein NVV81_04855 [Pseudomonas carnis]|uniref:hypothetical protein n=1 Tax=Pseudomonas carnis TaxID=2487355 RepID=UPI0021C8EF62|nr:hypothetical protein [Pseudomonas carnis]MCR8661689.1 hypothetical protein [Pseudomonas carnis]